MAEQIKKPQSNSRKMLVRSILGPLVLLVLLFVSAGRLNYWQGWLYLAITAITLTLMALLLTRDATLISERLQPGKGMKDWDRLYFALSTPLYLIALVVSGLDSGRFGWSAPFSPIGYILGTLIYLTGQAIFMWARYTNAYFSSVVRIQTDRGQTVCQDGPYRHVRHPGYVGGILFTLSMPLILGSWWGVIPQAVAVLLIIWRTGREDRTLQEELPGYLEYTRRTRYRLLPGVW